MASRTHPVTTAIEPGVPFQSLDSETWVYPSPQFHPEAASNTLEHAGAPFQSLDSETWVYPSPQFHPEAASNTLELAGAPFQSLDSETWVHPSQTITITQPQTASQ
jgi:hypothetical protein